MVVVGALIDFRTHMKSRLDRLVSDVVALFLHHLWNDEACSVYRNQPKLQGILLPATNEEGILNLNGHCYDHMIVFHWWFFFFLVFHYFHPCELEQETKR